MTGQGDALPNAVSVSLKRRGIAPAQGLGAGGSDPEKLIWTLITQINADFSWRSVFWPLHQAGE